MYYDVVSAGVLVPFSPPWEITITYFETSV